MNIDELSDQEKSVMLAKLCGWLTVDSGWYKYRTPDGKGTQVNATKGYSETDIFGLCPTLYNPANMVLAWEAMQVIGNTGLDDVIAYWFAEECICMMPPVAAQRLWLDKILTLAIEAGMVGETS